MDQRRRIQGKHLLLTQWINVGDGKAIHANGDKSDVHLDGSRLVVDFGGREFTATQEGDNVLVWSNGSRWQREEVCTD